MQVFHLNNMGVLELNDHFFYSGQSNGSKNVKLCRLYLYNSSYSLGFLQTFSYYNFGVYNSLRYSNFYLAFFLWWETCYRHQVSVLPFPSSVGVQNFFRYPIKPTSFNFSTNLEPLCEYLQGGGRSILVSSELPFFRFFGLHYFPNEFLCLSVFKHEINQIF